jgi:magnesium transporter
LTYLRRVLVNTRDASLHLQRDPNSLIDAEHQPYIRDIYDHVTRLLDSVETQRDLLNNTLDIYLSSVANRTNEVMKVLTVLGTIALPSLAISGIYGMNLKGVPFEDSPHGADWVGGITIVATALLLYVLRKLKWL